MQNRAGAALGLLLLQFLPSQRAAELIPAPPLPQPVLISEQFGGCRSGQAPSPGCAGHKAHLYPQNHSISSPEETFKIIEGEPMPEHLT